MTRLLKQKNTRKKEVVPKKRVGRPYTVKFEQLLTANEAVDNTP